MYNYSKKKYFHGIMFHHFHDHNKHLPGQGSINSNQFRRIIDYVGRKNIINATEFIERYKQKKLKKNHLCLTFDDALKCQFDIALPVLEDYKIKAFFFIYSSVLTNKPNLLEIYRFFRHNYYSSIDKFYEDFFDNLPKQKKQKLNDFFKRKKKIISEKKLYFNFYSENDIKFRLVRNYFISNITYEKVMQKLFYLKSFKKEKVENRIFLDKRDIIQLHKLEHQIGLHSHSHPTVMAKLNYKEQFIEYNKNILLLKKILKIKKINSMSHPCGSYNSHTLRILKKMKVEIGFRQIMSNNNANVSQFEICRQDHANIIRLMESSK